MLPFQPHLLPAQGTLHLGRLRCVDTPAHYGFQVFASAFPPQLCWGFRASSITIPSLGPPAQTLPTAAPAPEALSPPLTPNLHFSALRILFPLD